MLARLALIVAGGEGGGLVSRRGYTRLSSHLPHFYPPGVILTTTLLLYCRLPHIDINTRLLYWRLPWGYMLGYQIAIIVYQRLNRVLDMTLTVTVRWGRRQAVKLC